MIDLTISTVRKDISHINLNNFSDVLELMNTLNLSAPPIPDYTPPQDGLWHHSITGETKTSLPSTVGCVDLETIKDTQSLVMGSCWDLVNREWWLMISLPEVNPRISVEGKFIGLAHRASFENSFFIDAYNLNCNIRWFDTHGMAAQKYHPCQINLYRQQPWLPMFRDSNDLSLQELSTKLCGRALDKNLVEVFKLAQDESWREPVFLVHKKVKSQLEKQYKKDNQGFDSFQLWLEWVCPTGATVEIDHLLTSKNAKTSPYCWLITPTIEQLMEYNLTDVSATVGVFKHLWQWYRELPIPYIAGLYHRSIPFMPLANDWYDQIDKIELEFSKRIGEMVKLVAAIEQEYLEVVGENDWDNLDWGTWTKAAHGDKTGKLKWIGTTGLSSKQLMRISRLSWGGRPMVAIKQDKTIKIGKTDERVTVIKKDGTASETLVWWTVAPCDRDGNQLPVGDLDVCWLKSVQLSIDPQRLDNPNNTSTEPKDIVTCFSKSFLPFWDNGTLTSESAHARKVAEIYASISFWGSFRERITQQAMIYRNSDYASMALRPQVSGTITGRAIDKIGLVWSTPKESKVGSEISGHVCAPDGYTFVYADFDSLQAIITGLYAAIYQARADKIAHLPIDCLNNPYSVAVLMGNKKDKSTLAFLIAKNINKNWEQDWKDEQIQDREYSLAKNCSYAILFGCGVNKLALMCGSQEIAQTTMDYFKGVKIGGVYTGGIGSGYFNYVEELSSGLYQADKGKFFRLDELYSSFLKRPLPTILQSNHRGRDLSTTCNNAMVQAVDPECLNFLVDRIITECDRQGLFYRYSTTVHDANYGIAKIEEVDRVSEIFQQAHREMYEAFLSALKIDHATFPAHCWSFSGVDISTRYTKSAKEKGITFSNPSGYDYNISASLRYELEVEAISPDDFVSTSNLKKFWRDETAKRLEIEDLV